MADTRDPYKVRYVPLHGGFVCKSDENIRKWIEWRSAKMEGNMLYVNTFDARNGRRICKVKVDPEAKEWLSRQHLPNTVLLGTSGHFFLRDPQAPRQNGGNGDDDIVEEDDGPHARS